MYEDIPIRYYKGAEKGAHLNIDSGVHAGVERMPVESTLRLIEELDSGRLKLERGELTILPICNPPAYREHVRWFEDRNLNRMIRHYPNPQNAEEYFADQIAMEIDRPGVRLLDLHTFQAKTVKGEPAAFLTHDYPTPESAALVTARYSSGHGMAANEPEDRRVEYRRYYQLRLFAGKDRHNSGVRDE